MSQLALAGRALSRLPFRSCKRAIPRRYYSNDGKVRFDPTTYTQLSFSRPQPFEKILVANRGEIACRVSDAVPRW